MTEGPVQSHAKRIVIYHPEMGVYLGSCMGLGFWSKLDPVDQPCARTFSNAGEALEYMQTWDDGPLDDAAFVEVDPDMGGFASIQACINAGLPGWITAASETVNAEAA